MIIGISGKAQAGKDTLAEQILLRHAGFKLALADPLKVECAAYYKTEAEEMWRKKTEYVRTTLQGHGSVRRDTDPDWWVRTLFSSPMFLSLMSTNRDIFVTDVRYPNEIQWIKESGGEIWRIKRPGVIIKQSKHPSETHQDKVPDEQFDEVIDNVGTIAELGQKGLDILSSQQIADRRIKYQKLSIALYDHFKDVRDNDQEPLRDMYIRQRSTRYMFGVKEDPLI